MKHILILFLFTLRLLSQPNIDFYTLPQDYNHFIYFLQKTFSKEHQKLSIASQKFDLNALKRIMIKKRHSRFDIFVQEHYLTQNILQNLALYPHIHIYFCEEITKNMLAFKNKVIQSHASFDEKSLTHINQKLHIRLINKADSLYFITLKKVCKSY